IAQDVEHGAVVAHGDGDEGRNVLVSGIRRQAVEQRGSDAMLLPLILHDEGDLGLTAPCAVVADDGENLLTWTRATCREERHAVRVVYMREALGERLGQVRKRSEEAKDDGLERERGMEGAQPLGVIRPNRTHMKHAAIPQYELLVDPPRLGRDRIA